MADFLKKTGKKALGAAFFFTDLKEEGFVGAVYNNSPLSTPEDVLDLTICAGSFIRDVSKCMPPDTQQRRRESWARGPKY